MRKIKIFLTVFALYEFVMLTILQIPNYCISIFNYNFCETNFKYFLLCVMLPTLFGLFVWWIPDMLGVFQNKSCKCESNNNTEKFGMLNKQEIERFALALIVLLVNRFIKKHPKIKNIFDNLTNDDEK